MFVYVHVHGRGARVDGSGSAVHVVRFSWMYAGQEAVYWLKVKKIVWTKKFILLNALSWLRSAPESTEVLI